jgi:hypothetical protein
LDPTLVSSEALQHRLGAGALGVSIHDHLVIGRKG